MNALLNCHVCCTLVSEENEEPIIVPADRRGKYIVAFDPLDGSSNIDCNVSTGTIFAVYERVTPAGTEPGNADVLRPGTDVIAAGYCMYGSATDFVLTFRDGARARAQRAHALARVPASAHARETEHELRPTPP